MKRSIDHSVRRMDLLRIAGGIIVCALFGALSECIAQVAEVGGDIPLRLPFRPGEQYRVTQGYDQHSGFQVDFGMPVGTPIVACSAGVVVELGTYSGTSTGGGLTLKEQGGLFVKVQHPCSETGYAWYSSYLHLSSQRVTVGQKVDAGQIVGLSGNTGLSSGPHLHFHIRKGPADDPLNDLANHVGVRPTPIWGLEVGTGDCPIHNFTLEQSYQALSPSDMITSVMSSVASYQYYNDVGSETLTNGGFQSAIASYQYYNDVGSETLTNGGLLSAIASYQYYEWPGDDILKLENSPWVSYFYQGGVIGGVLDLHGSVMDQQGQPMGGVKIDARVMESLAASAITDNDGRYYLEGLPAGTYALSAVKTGCLSEYRVVALDVMRSEQSFQLRPLSASAQLSVASSAPSVIMPERGPGESILCVFDGTSFVPNLALLDHSKMTVVMTHGWIPSLSDRIEQPLETGWPKKLATKMAALNLLTHANIVAWDWRRVALAPLPPEESTPEQGIALGEALHDALGADYRQKVHFIGHSLGTLLNGYAVDYLHGYRRAGCSAAEQHWLPENTHITMSDEAAIARTISEEAIISLALEGMRAYAFSVALGWKNPVPHDFLWMDNYIASVGRYHPEAVNIVLQKAMLLELTEHDWYHAAIEAHSYPMGTWYMDTVGSSKPIMPGFGSSFEYNKLHPAVTFPPSGTAFVPGVAYRQVETSGDALDLEVVTDLDARLFYPAVSYAPEAVVKMAHSISDFIELPMEMKAIIGKRIGDVLVEQTQELAVGISDAMNRVVNGENNIWDGLVDLLNRPSLRIQLKTSLPPSYAGMSHVSDSTVRTNMPAVVWLPVVFPANVSVLAFDFVLEGDGKDDALFFGINDTNLFTLATRFIPLGMTNTSRYLDVSAWAGTTNELFFGILGGTSTNCTVRVDKIRLFASVPSAIAIEKDAIGKTTLSWSSHISGFHLETTTNIAGDSWETVSNSPSLFGGRFSVTNQWPEQTRFFRLRAP